MNNKSMLRRISALEENVGKLIQAVTGMALAVDVAQALPTECGLCHINPHNVTHCAMEDCPQGIEPKPENMVEDHEENFT